MGYIPNFVFKAILSWIFFPIGLFKSGLGWWGYTQHPEASRLTRFVNLMIGAGAVWFCFYYLDAKRSPYAQTYEQRGEDYFDRVFSAEGWQQPIDNFMEFYPWLREQLPNWGSVAWHYATLPIATPLDGYGLTVNALIILAALLLAPVVAVIFYTELNAARVRVALFFWGIRHRRWSRFRQKLRAEYPDEMPIGSDDFRGYMDRLPSQPEMPSTDGAYGALTGHVLDWRLRHRRFRLSLPRWMCSWELFQYKVGDTIIFLEGIITPAVTAVFSVLLFFPLLAVVGLWFLTAILLLLGFAPFAMLYNQGYRMRMH